MRIVIDLQAAQSPSSARRGIGRYSLALARAMARQRGDHEVIIALNGMFGDRLADWQDRFSDVLPAANVRMWQPLVPPMDVNGGPQGQHAAAQCVREAFLGSLGADFVHVTSVFEETGAAVTEFGHPAWPLRTAITLYDLIPLMNPAMYLDTPEKRRRYEPKLAMLHKADLLLAISDSARREALSELDIAPDRVVAISSDADPHFTPGRVEGPREMQLRARYGIPRPFVMYTGGIEARKNVDGLVRAWAQVPTPIRAAHQLAIVCSIHPGDAERLRELARHVGLDPERDLSLTGFVPDEDLVDLYRLCRLFVFPSRHEGFGLPALEAMRCGAPVIGAANSSLVEVIGCADAMFDASSSSQMAALIEKGLGDEGYREMLLENGRRQSVRFDWDRSARLAIAAMEDVLAAAPAKPAPSPPLRLALVTPWPPARSGIANASADLLPHLAGHYRVDLVTDLALAQVPTGATAVRSPGWFDAHAQAYDRIVYQLGNSSFHDFQFPLMERHPGTVILHDFFLSGVRAQQELDHPAGLAWSRALFQSQGWHALLDRMGAVDLTEIIWRYPANFDVLARAEGVIVHSAHAQELAADWYGRVWASRFAKVPLLRRPPAAVDRAGARSRLGLPPDAFVVCSMGMVNATKLHLELASAWKASAPGHAPGTMLVFVGELQQGEYCERVRAEVESLGEGARITGWVDDARYEDWLAACDVAVQLRTMSRGETSAAVLDCMNHGAAVIANRAGSMAELDPEAVWLLPEAFNEAELAQALTALWKDPARRDAMARRARALIATRHSPAACAAAYAAAIESFADRRRFAPDNIVRETGALLPYETPAEFVAGLARGIAFTFPPPSPCRRLLVTVVDGAGEVPQHVAELLRAAPRGWRVEPVYLDPGQRWRYARGAVLRKLKCKNLLELEDDALEIEAGDWWALPAPDAHPLPPVAAAAGIRTLVLPAEAKPERVWAVLRALAGPEGRRWWMDLSEMVVRDWGSGIQRVVKNHLFELLLHPPEGVQVVPLYAKANVPGYRVARRYLLDWAGISMPVVDDMPARPRPGDVFFGLDLQPSVAAEQAPLLAKFRADGVKVGFLVHDLLPIRLPQYFHPGAPSIFGPWLRVIANSDFAVCVSQATADDMRQWMREQLLPAPAVVRTVHNGADLGHTLGSRGLPADAFERLARIKAVPSFLMVGTLEPRKAHAEVLDAVERLWSRGEDAGLVFVGHAGWMVDDLVARLRSHAEAGRRLFWIEDATDEFLQQVYSVCGALVAASHGEGFGLPLVEAAQYGLPVIARDLPVFREIAGDWAFYFEDDAPDALADRLAQWLAQWRAGRAKPTHAMPRSSWTQSTARLVDVLREVDGR